MIRVIIEQSWIPEKTYALQLLLGEVLGLPFLMEARAGQKGYLLELPNGNQLEFQDIFFKKKPDGAAYTKADMPLERELYGLYNLLPRPMHNRLVPVIYGDAAITLAPHKITYGLDMVGGIFFMATRWEESVMPDRDQYGRFPGKASWAHRSDNLCRPVVHVYAELLWDSLIYLGWPPQERSSQKPQIVLSCDVDHPRLWWEPWEVLRTVGGAFKRGKALEELRYWRNNWKKTKRDPFDTFDQLTKFAGDTPVQFNFLGKRPRHFDCWYNIDHPTVHKIMRTLQQAGHTIGFHPSREAHTDRERFEQELESVRRVANAPVTTGRQHYLLFDAPTTWQLWEDLGMTEDSSVGYRDVPGFRTGMAIDFPVFNFKTRKMLRLRERPLTIMDITFAEHSTHFQENNRWEHYALIARGAAQLGGQMSILWHNSSIQTPKWAHEWQEIGKLKNYFDQQLTKQNP